MIPQLRLVWFNDSNGLWLIMLQSNQRLTAL